ncbi:KAP family P-loop NTPase fold protein [Adlercreutzia caecimuris]|uniref:KAP family P-loop NTPase fold protein n=1 Tax=Adlercreutzia caecimuris TaxID=671266 RepID=UPI00272C64F5|nr:P-loop NTPase fold protein [Adlercreutzia caecimuris]
MSGITDNPVSEINGDRFKIGQYIKGLCAFILNCETPMTISIQGDWGSGKTSMMNMIRGEIENEVFPIMFNTWQFSQFNQSSALAPAMIGYLIDELTPEQGRGTEIITKAKKLQGALRMVAILGAGALGGADGAGTVKEALDGKTEDGERIDPSKALLELKDTFQQAIQTKLDETGKSRVVVFVDDLDRLQPEKAVELLEVLKLFLDCENCVFVLAVDYEVVTRGIKKKFGEDVDGVKGKSFFDKIIQLPFKMPVSNYDVKQYIQENLKAMKLECTDEDADVYVELLRSSIGLNPRAMKRLFNTFQLLDIISADAVSGVPASTRQRMLFGIICMQMAFEGLYGEIAAQCRGSLTSEELVELAGEDYVARPESELYKSLAELGDGDEEESRAVARMQAFMVNLVNAVDADGNSKIDDKELQEFKEIMRCSSVTSVTEDAGSGHSDRDWGIRRNVQALARKAEPLLREKIASSGMIPNLKKCRAKFPRKNFHQSIVEAIFSVPELGDTGLFAYIDYVDEGHSRLDIWIESWSKSVTPEARERVLGEDPLCLGVTPVVSANGNYGYELGVVNNSEIPSRIVDEFVASLESLKVQGIYPKQGK